MSLHRVREKSLGRQALRIASIRRFGIVDRDAHHRIDRRIPRAAPQNPHRVRIAGLPTNHLAAWPRFYLFIVTTGVHYRLIRVDRAVRPAE